MLNLTSLCESIQHFLVFTAHVGHINQWNDGCEDQKYADVCRSNSAVFRLSMALVIFFFIQALCSYFTAHWYDILWPIKFLCFTGLVVGLFLASSEVFDSRGYAWFARFGGFIFIILQQIILIDFAYIWNEKWVNFATEAGRDFYLYVLVIISVVLYLVSATSIAFMFIWFSKADCPDNDAILSLTVIFSTFATIYSLFFTERGSLLISAIIVIYATYVCFSSIALNPNVECNPTIGTASQNYSQIAGMFITFISLSWTAWTTVRKVQADNVNEHPELSNVAIAENGEIKKKPTATDNSAAGLAAGSSTGVSSAPAAPPNGDRMNREVSVTDVQRSPSGQRVDPYRCCCYDISGNEVDSAERRGLFAQVSVVFLLISAYYAMVLTNWATERDGKDVSSQKEGEAAMWLQATAQWICLLMYIWTLVAPDIFPDRDFG